MKKLFSNTRKPAGFLGKIMLLCMNRGHAEVSDWGLSKLPPLQPCQIADLGCGGGRNAAVLLQKYPQAQVRALDHSELSVAKTEKRNRASVESGRCQVIQGSVEALPFDENTFDLVTAFETIYFWRGPGDSFREVFRVLKPNGLFLIVNETDGNAPDDAKWAERIDGMRVYDQKHLVNILHDVGFGEFEIYRDEAKHFLCIIGKKL